MDRAFLIALLGIPILVVLHIALFWQPIPWGGETFWTAAQDGEHLQLRGNWQSEQTNSTRFVIEQVAERGS